MSFGIGDIVGLASGLAKVADNLTEADQQIIRSAIRTMALQRRAINIAEEIFTGRVDTSPFGDNSHPGVIELLPRKDKNNRWFWLLLEKFNKYD